MLLRALFAMSLLLPTVSFAQESDPWEWHSVAGSVCRDGSEAGYFMKRRTADDRALILLEGGGACFNLVTCAINPQSANASFPKDQGIFEDRTDNPVLGWNLIYVPYCSGDIHGGNRRNVTVLGLKKKQNYMGAENIKLIADDVGRKIPMLDHLVFSGVSAGGFGAILNFASIKERFPNIPVTLLDDSGVPLEDEFVDPCLQKKFRDTWGLNKTFPEDCTDCNPKNGGGLINFARYIQENYSDRQQGAIMSERDKTLRFFFGYSKNKCMTLTPDIPASTYARGVASVKANFLNGSIKSFIVPGEQHTFINSSLFYTQKMGGQSLSSWVGDLIENRAVNRP
ncbi:MAG: pectin acetylesterase-family hydrolase [Bdellovibrionota bacterium]